MILYATKETFERYRFKLPADISEQKIAALAQETLVREQGDRLLEWGAKLFYFNRSKCIQLVNFASKLTFVVCDIKVGEAGDIPQYLAHYLVDLYADDPEMTKLVARYLTEHGGVSVARLKDKSAIATLNHTQSDVLWDGDRLWDYVDGGILHTVELNRFINREWLFTQKVDGKTVYFHPAERFCELLMERYAVQREG